MKSKFISPFQSHRVRRIVFKPIEVADVQKRTKRTGP